VKKNLIFRRHSVAIFVIFKNKRQTVIPSLTFAVKKKENLIFCRHSVAIFVIFKNKNACSLSCPSVHTFNSLQEIYEEYSLHEHPMASSMTSFEAFSTISRPQVSNNFQSNILNKATLETHCFQFTNKKFPKKAYTSQTTNFKQTTSS